MLVGGGVVRIYLVFMIFALLYSLHRLKLVIDILNIALNIYIITPLSPLRTHLVATHFLR